MAVTRICPHCGVANDAAAPFCGACATQIASTSRALVRADSAPAPLARLSPQDKATIGGVAVGMLALALRVGSALLQRRSEAPPALPAAPPPPPGDQIRVRRRWVTGDRDGPQQWGEEEIEIDRPADDRSSIRLWLGRRP